MRAPLTMVRTRVVVVFAALVAYGVLAGPASAAFRGRDGLLAVQPVRGAGVLLVRSGGQHPHRVCGSLPVCRSAQTPRWSPDGREFAVSSAVDVQSGVTTAAVLYADGTCADCHLGSARTAFTASADVLSGLSYGNTLPPGGELTTFSSNGGPDHTTVAYHVTDAVWSSQGRLAIVRSGRIAAGRPTALRSLGAGADPSWSPDGSRLVIDRGGWVMILRAGGGPARRLVRGSAPAWSPDGRAIAFIAAGDRVKILTLATRAVHSVGGVRGVTVDWQPRPAGGTRPAAHCTSPAGSRIVASSATGVVTAVDHRSEDGATDSAYSACLFADGRQRFIGILGSASGGYTYSVSQIVTTGGLAAVLTHYADKYMAESDAVSVYDMRTGLQVRKLSYVAIANDDCTPCQCDAECTTGADDLVLGADGVSAVHAAIEGSSVVHPIERIVANDASGVVVRDQVNPPNGYAVLTGLQLTGDTLTWLHAGVPRSVTLTPPPG